MNSLELRIINSFGQLFVVLEECMDRVLTLTYPFFSPFIPEVSQPWQVVPESLSSGSVMRVKLSAAWKLPVTTSGASCKSSRRCPRFVTSYIATFECEISIRNGKLEYVVVLDVIPYLQGTSIRALSGFSPAAPSNFQMKRQCQLPTPARVRNHPSVKSASRGFSFGEGLPLRPSAASEAVFSTLPLE